ncbi:MAG: hypothetical protein KTR15_02225 [Phycisphaeraceae bacterium]|nr:hypothetical protein [Phycisphaeraceae bacterium]
MTDQRHNPIDRELREQEATESGLTLFFASLVPPFGAKERLLDKLDNTFHESMLTLDDQGPYSFEEAAAMAQIDEVTTDLLAAGLEEEPIDDDDVDEDE